MPLKKQMLIII